MKQNDIDAIRAFNRFYTNVIGLLDKYILNSKYSLPEVRVMYELYVNKSLRASDITSHLHIDKGYLSRIIKQFALKNIITKNKSKNDGRALHILLTNNGIKEFEKLNEASNQQIANILSQLTPADCNSLLNHMMAIKTILEKAKL